MRRKLTERQKIKLIEDYQSGNFTRPELAIIYRVSRQTIDNYLKGVHKPFKYDAMNKAISLDYLKEYGIEVVSPPEHIMELLPGQEFEQQWTNKQYPCPHCGQFRSARQLIPHMIKYHHRDDLEYLIERENEDE